MRRERGQPGRWLASRSFCQSVILSFHQSVVQSICLFKLSVSHSFISSFSHSVIPSVSHSFIPSSTHSVTLPAITQATCSLAAPLKKMILLRWQEKATPGDGDLRPPHTQALRTAVVSSEKTGTSMSENLSSKPPQGAQDKCQSPLFEEFSDDEFEVVKESRASGEREAGVMETTDLTDLSDSREGEREGVGKMEDMGHLVGDSRHEEGEGQESGSDLNISNISDVSDVSMESKPHPSQTPPPPATPPNAVNVSDISSDMDLREESVEGEEAPPPPLISSGPTTMEGGKAAGKEEEEGRGGEREEEGERLGGGSHRARSLEEVMLESQGRGVEEEGGRREMRGGKSLEDLLDSAGGMGEFAPEMGQLSARKQLGIEGREGEGGGSLTASPETKEGQAPLAGTPLTPAGGVPGRRKKVCSTLTLVFIPW